MIDSGVNRVMTSHHPFSPSNLGRRKLCPGSYLQEIDIGDSVDASEDAAEGTLLHGLVNPAFPAPDSITDEQEDTILRARDFLKRKTADANNIYYELKGVLSLSGRTVTHGTMDLVAYVFSSVTPDFVRVIDWKFGRNQLYQITTELQMRAYAGMAMQYFGVKRAEVYVYQPRLDLELFGAYENPEIIAKEIDVIILDSLSSSNDNLYPSCEACRHCRAKISCPAFKPAILDALPARAQLGEILSPEKLARALEFASVVSPWIDEIREYAKKAISEGQEIPGWELFTRKMRKIANNRGIVGGLGDVLTPWDILDCAKISIGAIEDLYARKSKENGVSNTMKDAKERLKKLLSPYIVTDNQEILRRRSEP